jgi:DNA-directed RNA polymerase subunit N (RpoN/RPB10)
VVLGLTRYCCAGMVWGGKILRAVALIGVEPREMYI